MASIQTTSPSKESQNNENLPQIKPTSSCQYVTSSSCSETQQSVESMEQRVKNNDEEVPEENINSNGFTTPKAKRFRIPKIMLDNCPPAPKRGMVKKD